MKRTEEGSATTAVLGAVVVVLLLASLGVFVGMVHSYKVRVQAVADLSAVAGAAAAPSALAVGSGNAGVPCSVAREVAERNGANLTLCEAIGGDLRVITRAAVPVLPGSNLSGAHVQGKARAGPDTPAR